MEALHGVRVFGGVRLADRGEQPRPAIPDFAVAVLLDLNRQIAGLERDIPVVIHQMVHGQPELSGDRVPVVILIAELAEQVPRLDNVLLGAGGALIVWGTTRSTASSSTRSRY